MITCSRVRNQAERDRRDGLAVAVWVESVAVGSLLGAAGAVVMVAIGVAADGTEPLGPAGALFVALFAAVLGAGFGFILGTVVGLVLALLVGLGQRRLGPRVVATLMPLAAATVTEPLTCLFARAYYYDTPLVVAMSVVGAVATVPGSVWIARRYLRRAEGRRVH
jgi:hypothetical protein